MSLLSINKSIRKYREHADDDDKSSSPASNFKIKLKQFTLDFYFRRQQFSAAFRLPQLADFIISVATDKNDDHSKSILLEWICWSWPRSRPTTVAEIQPYDKPIENPSHSEGETKI